MARIFRLVAVLLGLAAAPVQAAFHLWTMNELYSNADGTVQYLELTALTGSQQFLTGQQLVSTDAHSPATRAFTFPSNLPGDTSGRRMLIATQGFAALGVVTPDYVVPNGFFFAGGGTVNFASSSDVWNHGVLPADNRAIDRAGNAITPSPTNFAGQTGVLTQPAPAAFNVQGLWYRGEVERGWGVNVAHHGEILFVTWFTYDTDGSQMWLVGPEVRKTTGNTYTGALFRTNGPSFASYNASQLQFSQAGTVTLSFSDANNGTFSYTVGSVTQSKPIIRQVFSTIPTCTAGGSHGASPNFQDLWYAGEVERGWGVNLTHQGDILFVTWFTYDTNGRGMWLVGPNVARTTGNTFTGALFRTTGPAFSNNPWDPAGLGFTEVGNATFAFSDANGGTFSYTVNGTSGSKAITRQVFALPATICR